MSAKDFRFWSMAYLALSIVAMVAGVSDAKVAAVLVMATVTYCASEILKALGK